MDRTREASLKDRILGEPDLSRGQEEACQTLFSCSDRTLEYRLSCWVH